MNKLSLYLASAVIAFSTFSAQARTLDGNVAVTSDYVFRGITQTNENSAFQGSVGLQFNSGLYAEGFASQVELAGNDTQLNATAGYRTTYKVLNIDAGITRYSYLGGTDIDTSEVFVGVSGDVGVVKVTGTVNQNLDTDAIYYNAKGKFTPFLGISAIASYGVLDVDGADNVNDWYLALGKKFYGLNVEAGYYANDADFDLATLTDNKVAVKVSYNF